MWALTIARNVHRDIAVERTKRWALFAPLDTADLAIHPVEERLYREPALCISDYVNGVGEARVAGAISASEAKAYALASGEINIW